MMLTGKFVVSDIYVSDKGSTYITMVDLTEGGTCKLTVSGTAEVQPGSIVEADLAVKASTDKAGGNYLRFVNGTLKRVQ